MRWAALFADLDGQLEQAAAEEVHAEVADRTRREVARLRLVDRVRAARGAPVTLGVSGAGQVEGRLNRAGADWWLVDAGRTEVVVAAAAVTWAVGLPVAAAEPDDVGMVASRFTLPYVLRAVARDRSAVLLVLRDGARFTGTIDRVGADFFDLAEHPLDEARRQRDVAGVRAIRTAALAVLHRG